MNDGRWQLFHETQNTNRTKQTISQDNVIIELMRNSEINQGAGRLLGTFCIYILDVENNSGNWLAPEVIHNMTFDMPRL